mgnify:CR=1 FL=1
MVNTASALLLDASGQSDWRILDTDFSGPDARYYPLVAAALRASMEPDLPASRVAQRHHPGPLGEHRSARGVELDQLAELLSRGTGIYTAVTDDLDGDNPVRVTVVGLEAEQRQAALDGLTIEARGVSFGLDSHGAFVPGTSAWFGYIYGNADRILVHKKTISVFLDTLKADELEEVIAGWISRGETPSVWDGNRGT